MNNNIFEKLGKGRMVRIWYTAELPVKAEYKKQGIQILKYIETTVRTGVPYSNMGKVIAKRNAPDYVSPKPRAMNYEWIIPNVLTKNENTGRTYLYAATMTKGSHTKSTYKMVGTDENPLDVLQKYVIPSYFSEKEIPPIINIPVDNIKKIKINKVVMNND